MDNNFSIAMTPLQLAAVMSDETVSESAVGNRIWGSVNFLGGVLELAAATSLCLVPEPTGVTKAGCIIVGAHSMDTIRASAYQVYTGQQTSTIMSQLASGIAKDLGASDDTAEQIGIAVDVVLPFSVAGAARVASVRLGQVRLMSHEAVKGIHGGGHTLKKHVGKSVEDLIDKIDRGLKSRTLDISGFSSSFPSIEVAEKAVSQTIKANRNIIRSWARSTPAGSHERILKIEYSAQNTVGIIVSAESKMVSETNKVRVVLLKEIYNKKPYYVLTAYPIK
ncbi:RNase A-like domain-containing protein [Serratia sp. UGAL515B_01]|uniref:RNase A-like domain-containing protein n=1 Tax=Serratia sp. UGAL515B_01 TaxID=2986763 RepID=UPI002955BB1B|nr:RNase A-like domain-containing protein [Serratia sp. UGAL515B_01]WON77818.1 hypothetical protein OK023_03795 [Serratia sp. UGAL515B_01]